MSEAALPIEKFTPLNLRSKHVSYGLRAEDIEVIQALYQHLCTITGSKLAYVEFFRLANATLLGRVITSGTENIVVKVVELSPISHIEENKLLRKELVELKKQLTIEEVEEEDINIPSADTVQLLTTEVEKLEQKLKEAISSRDYYKSKSESLQEQMEADNEDFLTNKVILKTSLLPLFEESLSRRIESKLSENREDFIRQLYEYTRSTQPAKYF